MPFSYSNLEEAFGNQWNNPKNDEDNESNISNISNIYPDRNQQNHVPLYKIQKEKKRPKFVPNPEVENTFRGISYGSKFNKQLEPLDHKKHKDRYNLFYQEENEKDKKEKNSLKKHNKSSLKNKEKNVHFHKKEKETFTLDDDDNETNTDFNDSKSNISILSQSPYEISDPECVASYRHLISCHRCKAYMKFKILEWMKEKQKKIDSNILEHFGNEDETSYIKSKKINPQNKNQESIFLYFLFGCLLLVAFDWYRKLGMR